VGNRDNDQTSDVHPINQRERETSKQSTRVPNVVGRAEGRMLSEQRTHALDFDQQFLT
jgi:hypothetical protein